MESESMASLTRNSEIDNLIIAAAAASGDEDLEGETICEQSNSIRNAAKAVCASRSEKLFEPEPYSRKQGSEIAYQEMAELMSFRGESDDPERVELMRKHSMIFRPSGPNSRSLTLYEQAVNEAAAQIAFHFPAAIYHKRDLAILAKQAVRLTGFEFPNARGGYYPPGSIVPGRSDTDELDYSDSQSGVPTVQPAHAAPASASMLLHKSRLDDEMDLIREISAVCGRASGASRGSSSNLTPYELGLNEAAAWLVRLQPVLLTHSRQLAELARRIIAVSGLQLRHTGGSNQTSGSHGYNQAYGIDKWYDLSHPMMLRVSSGKHATGHAGDVVQIRLQGETYPSDPMNFGGDMFGSMVVQNGTPYYVDTAGGAGGSSLLSSIGGMNSFEDEVASSGLDSNELVQLLGGSQAIAQLSDVQLEELGRAQFTVVDPRADSEMANCPLSLSVEEDDRPLDEAEILRVSRASCLERVRVLSLPACGYTSINALHLARCVNLRLLDLSENALRVFPRRLHLPRLKRLSLTGNRFIHLPLVEQFPELTRLTVDEKIKQMLNPQMLAYFCPKLKIINGQCFDEMRTDFTVRIVQEARAIVEPHIRSKWEAEFADHYHSVRNREERMQLIEHMVQHLRERNLLMDEALTKYRDLLFFQFVQQYLQSKLYDAAEADFLAGVNTDGKPAQSDLPDYTPEDLLAESSGTDYETPKPEVAPRPSVNVTIDMEPDDTADEDDEAEKEAENRAATERALFEATDELLGVNLPDPLSFIQAAAAAGQVQTTLVMDSMGRLHQQQQIVVAPTAAAGYQLATAASSGTNQFHLARSLRQGRSVVMTIVRPRGVSGRPVAEFLPGELRNKDYVKGYMASEIYKKAVKDTLGQKATPKKKPGVARPKRADTSGWPSSPGSGLVPLGEVNTDLSGSTKKGISAAGGGARGTVGGGRHAKGDYEMDEDQHGLSASTAVPPRPKKRKAMGAHRSLRDLCSESAFGADAYGSVGAGIGGGPRSDATPIDYDPLHFIRCHAKDNDAGDSETKVWRCLFEPNPLRPEETTHVVATCGGECVCLINCETGKVMKRFKHMEEVSEFR
ncbi:unnamed protein product [Echinostoma caproni]|uniref:ANK_REP_REGION domain-containing protein n=1 Tax=Echinostoma caproni TaxID=27848 RepID=A0A183ASQ0_9TREM|nr:unnamed protein product [Echinostoma caproni]